MRMRILHVAYEDPQQPGSGGGSVRTWEINRRLSQRHEIVALVSAYPGAAERTEGGIHWIPLGSRSGGKLSRLSYASLVNWEVARRSYDLVVEDFGAPFSTAFTPLLARGPVIASVQWLFAFEMWKKYHLPFHWIERAGLPLYDDFIAVSAWLADEIRARRPDTRIEIIPNGVDPDAFSTALREPIHLLFVGRLDVQQKGGDLLIDIMKRCAARLGERCPNLLIVGDGPDRERIERRVHHLQLSHLVDFRGRVEGSDKYDLMASSYAVLMPSRHETFGMVAVEAQAAGAPVVTFDVGPLREVIGEGGARLVPPFDVDAFAEEVISLVVNPTLRGDLHEVGRQWAKRYDWNRLAIQQEQHYLAAISRKSRGVR